MLSQPNAAIDVHMSTDCKSLHLGSRRGGRVGAKVPGHGRMKVAGNSRV